MLGCRWWVYSGAVLGEIFGTLFSFQRSVNVQTFYVRVLALSSPEDFKLWFVFDVGVLGMFHKRALYATPLD